MPCYFPVQAVFSYRRDGKRDVRFDSLNHDRFLNGESLHLLPGDDGHLALPCGRCIGCRLERSRQWAMRIMHEAKLYEDNCFVTLTFDEEHLATMCPSGSLVKKHLQDFVKRLRKKFPDRLIRYFSCGEYGDELKRPHYHLCLFNVDFEDKKVFKVVNGFNYCISDVLSSLWEFGHSMVAELTFESAAYVARYCTKKINGDLAEKHYEGRLPEFALMSLKPGIGQAWYKKFGQSDCFNFDEVVVRGAKCKPPRYYDKLLERENPARMDDIKFAREKRAEDRAHENSHERLMVRKHCKEAKIGSLLRRYESEF